MTDPENIEEPEQAQEPDSEAQESAEAESQLDDAQPSTASRLAGRWQAPLFLLGVLLCAAAAFFMVSRIPEYDWQERYSAVVYMVDSVEDGDYGAADAAARKLLAETFEDEEPDERVAKVYLLQARIRLLAIKHTGVADEEQLSDLVAEFRKAEDHGAHLSADAHEQMGDALVTLGELDKALDRYEMAWTVDPTRRARLMRQGIEIRRERGLLSDRQYVDALNTFMGLPVLTDEQYGWAIGSKLDVMIADDRLDEAEQLIDRLLYSGVQFRNPLRYQKARILILRSQRSEDRQRAELLARQADDILIELTHTLAAADPTGQLAVRANLLRGLLIRDDNPREALRAFEAVVEHAPASVEATAARHGVGVVKFRLGFYEEALEHFEQVLSDLQAAPANPQIDLEQLHRTVSAMRETLLSDAKPSLAIEYAELDRRILEAQQAPPASLTAKLESLGRLARAHLQRAERLASDREQARAELAEPEAVAAFEQGRREHLIRAGRVFMERAALASAAEDEIHGESLWAAGLAFDRAGRPDLTAEALETFVQTRTSDPRRREALYRLGQAYQAMGRYDDAIAAYQQNEQLGRKHPMAVAGIIPMVRCYLAKGPEFQDEAERYLRRILYDDERARPDSQVYIEALYVLGRLAYDRRQWDVAVATLGEAIQRQPGRAVSLSEPDPENMREKFLRATHSMYITAECYRAAANEAAELAAAQNNVLRRNELLQSRRDKLQQADMIYQRVINRLESLEQLSAVNEAYRRNSYFARGECMYELGRFDEAIERLEQAVFLFSQDPAALGGLVQIYNSHMALGQLEYARAASRRGQVLLEQMRQEGEHSAETLDHWAQWFQAIERADRILPERNTL